MRRLILIAAMALFSATAYAQHEKGDKSIGLGAAYGTEISEYGIDVRVAYYFNPRTRTELSANMYSAHEGINSWDLNLNFHYLIPLVKERFFCYPLLGLTYSFWKFVPEPIEITEEGESKYEYDLDNKESRFGTNIGMGVEFAVTPSILINLEGRYQMISDFNQFVAVLGISHKF